MGTNVHLPRMYWLRRTVHGTGSWLKSWLRVERAGSTMKGIRKRNRENEQIPGVGIIYSPEIRSDPLLKRSPPFWTQISFSQVLMSKKGPKAPKTV